MSATECAGSATDTLAIAQVQKAVPLVHPAEAILLALVGSLAGASGITALWQHQAVDWVAFLPAFVASLILIVIGLYVRTVKGTPRLALGVIGFGIFMAFSACSAIFIFTLFPFANPLIDGTLAAMDAALGYTWTGFATGFADYPVLAKLLGVVYLTALPQIVGVIVLLAFLHRATALYRFLLVGIIGMILTVAIWWSFPSVGPAAFGMVPADVQVQIALQANANYGAQLRQLMAEGASFITPGMIIGVIAFPSFHTVMACMVVWFTKGTGAFIPALLVNTAMLPATLLHGGHYLVDLSGGLAIFAIALWAAIRLAPTRHRA